MDPATLLAPISEEAAAGDDLSFSPEFDAIQEMRRADDPTLDQGEWVTAIKAADWPGVRAACEAILANRSKDLRVAAWLTEADARLEGYVGLADGLDLCAALCHDFWSTLYPQIDAGGDSEERSGSLRWLLAQVETLARQMPVLRQGTRAFSLLDMDASRTSPVVADEPGDGSASPALPLTPEVIAAARRATTQVFFVANLAAAQRSLDALARLQSLVDAALGSEGPGFSGARRALEDAVHAVKRLAGDVVEAPTAEMSTTGTAFEGSASSTGPIRTRADALRQLRAVADFFRRTEPHSPVAYLAERGAQWGEMPLHEWLRSVVKDEGVLAQVEELLGIAARPAAAE